MTNLVGAVLNFVNGVRDLFKELYRTPPGC